MDSTFIFPLLYGMIPVFIIGVIIALIVYAVKRKQGVTTEVAFTPKFILKIYLYFMILASIVTFVGGFSFILNATFANQFGEAFSYRAQYTESRMTPAVKTPTKEAVIDYPQPTYEVPAHSTERDLIRGLTMVIFALIVGFIHLLVIRAVETKEERKHSPLYRLYIVMGLSIFTIGSLISIPVGIYNALSYQLIEQSANTEPYLLLVPGESLSSAIAYLPFWIYFIWALYALQKMHKVEMEKLSVKAKTKK